MRSADLASLPAARSVVSAQKAALAALNVSYRALLEDNGIFYAYVIKFTIIANGSKRADKAILDQAFPADDDRPAHHAVFYNRSFPYFHPAGIRLSLSTSPGRRPGRPWCR